VAAHLINRSQEAGEWVTMSRDEIRRVLSSGAIGGEIPKGLQGMINEELLEEIGENEFTLTNTALEKIHEQYSAEPQTGNET